MDNMFEFMQKYLSGGCTPDEKIIIESWIAESPENLKIFNETKEIWETSENISEGIKLHPEAAWNRIKLKTGISESRMKIIKLSPYRKILRVAAIFLLLLGIGLLIKISFYGGRNHITISTLNSAKQEIRLADGSVVYLNRGSKLIFPEKFITATREIELEGEGFFKVAKDSTHPFIVHAKGTITKVLGTSFNINTKNPEQIKIAVFSGKVAFRPEGSGKQELKLTKGESGSFNKTNFSLTKQTGENDNAIAWQTGILKFNNTSLPEAANILSGYYSQTIEIDPILQKRYISVTFDNQPLDKVLGILELTLSIRVEKTPGKIMLKPL